MTHFHEFPISANTSANGHTVYNPFVGISGLAVDDVVNVKGIEIRLRCYRGSQSTTYTGAARVVVVKNKTYAGQLPAIADFMNTSDFDSSFKRNQDSDYFLQKDTGEALPVTLVSHWETNEEAESGVIASYSTGCGPRYADLVSTGYERVNYSFTTDATTTTAVSMTGEVLLLAVYARSFILAFDGLITVWYDVNE